MDHGAALFEFQVIIGTITIVLFLYAIWMELKGKG